MLQYTRLLVRPIKIQNAFSSLLVNQSQRTSVTATGDKPKENFIDRNERLKRPMSPHLTIYKFQITSVMSITHRGTGVVLTGGLYGLALTTLLQSGTFPQLVTALQNMHISPALVFTTKLALSWSFFYHFFNGIRHLVWDTGLGFDLKHLYLSGYLVLGVSSVVAIACAMA